MASSQYTYEQIREMADMSVDDFKKKYGNGSFLGLGGKSDTTIQNILDAAKSAEEQYGDIVSGWDDVMSEAQASYNDMYRESLKYLTATANVDPEAQDSIFNASVSDNQADGTVVDGKTLENITVDGGDGTQVDWSETQTMKKTRLPGGSFRDTDSSGVEFDDFSGEPVGTTKSVAGGTITYLGVAQYAPLEFVDVDDKNFIQTKDYTPINDTQRGTIVHYEGYLGSFDYNTRDFEIAYYETEVNGNKISVPTLHYIGDEGVGVVGNSGKVGITDGSKIKIPEGLKNADYMFAGNQNITSMPELPDSIESAHGMFMNCTGMTKACDGALDADGNIKMPSKLKDISWMFAGCSQMTQSFGAMGEEMLDARYAFAGCKKLGYVAENGADGEMNNTFTVPDMTYLRYANAEYLRNMFDGTNPEINKKITAYLNENGDFGSSYTLKDGSHNNDFDKLVDGSFDGNKELLIAEESSRQAILRMIDKNAKGTTGVDADTEGLISETVRLTDDGTFADDSVWAKFLQDDFTGTYHEDNQFGEILDHAIPAVGTYAVSKSLLNKMTNGKHKAISTIGAVALAAVPQVVGFGNTLTPMLDWTANVIGEDTKVGKFLSNLSGKLKGVDVNYSTKVEELNADKTFEAMQDSAVNFAAKQISNPLKTQIMPVDGEEKSVIPVTVFDRCAKYMAENGKNIADDANLLFIACEPEENLKNTMSDGIMKTVTDSLHAKMDAAISAANGDPEKLQAVAEEYSGYYQTLLYNLSAYNDAAVEEVGNQYMNSPELKAQAMNGLEKVMRNTAEPLYSEMKSLQDTWKKEYGIDFFSDKQLNDNSDKLSIKNANIAGLGKFADYDPNKDYSDQSDVYVEKLEVYQKALVEAVQNASSQEEIDAAYASYYETAYGWALDEAEKHGVVLDKRGAQTTAEKDSFAEYVAKVESETQETFETESEEGKQMADNSEDKSAETDAGANTGMTESEEEKATRRAAMVGVEDADTAAAEKAAISELNI